MGVTIHYTAMQTRDRVVATLDHGEIVARVFKKQADALGVPFEISRDDNALFIDIGGCETLGFQFQRFNDVWNDWRKPYGEKWRVFDQNETDEHYQRWPGQVSWWVSGFCKTQFSENTLEHVWCAEIVRAVVGMCKVAYVYDEGDYYHTRKMSDAQKAIAENGALIDSIAGALQAKGWEIQK